MLDLHAATLDRARPLRDARRRPPLRDVGVATSPAASGSAWPSTTPSAGASTPSPSATPRWPPASARAWPTIPGVTVRDRGEQLCAITTFTVDGVDPRTSQRRAARRRASTCRVSHRSTRPSSTSSHRGLESVVRASRPLRRRPTTSSTASPAIVADARRRASSAAAADPHLDRRGAEVEAPRGGCARGSGGRSAGTSRLANSVKVGGSVAAWVA